MADGDTERAWQRRTSGSRGWGAVLFTFFVCLGAAAPSAGCEGNACSDPGPLGKDVGWRSCVDREPVSAESAESCCGGSGVCVNESVLTATQASQVAQDACTAGGHVCLPKELAIPGFTPAVCRSVAGAEGRCLSECLPSVRQATGAPQSTCPASSRCLPCYDVIGGAPTGACSLTAHDVPAEPPTLLAPCCDGLGRCLPLADLPADQASLLQQDACTSATDRCVPEGLIGGADQPPASCSTSDGAQGHCLSICLASVAPLSGSLARSTCEQGSRCVPL